MGSSPTPGTLIALCDEVEGDSALSAGLNVGTLWALLLFSGRGAAHAAQSWRKAGAAADRSSRLRVPNFPPPALVCAFFSILDLHHAMPFSNNAVATSLHERIVGGTATLGVIGLGYVGLPLAVEMAAAGFRTIGFEVARAVVDGINRGESHIGDVASETVARLTAAGTLEATADLGRLAECDAISICVPTPLSKTKDPDLSFVVSATQAVARRAAARAADHPGEHHLSGHHAGGDAAGAGGEGARGRARTSSSASRPERVDPGNPVWHTRNTPKVIGRHHRRVHRRSGGALLARSSRRSSRSPARRRRSW